MEEESVFNDRMTEAVCQYLKDTGYHVNAFSKEESIEESKKVEVLLRKMQIETLSGILRETFKCKDTIIQKFEEWMSKQTRLSDGCVEIVFIPCSMGVILKAKNVFDDSKIDLTEYEK